MSTDKNWEHTVDQVVAVTALSRDEAKKALLRLADAVTERQQWMDCHEAVVPDWADGEEMPCAAPAVAMRLDENEPYPVCIAHVREPMVRLERNAGADQ